VISGIVVSTRPEALAEVGREIDALDYADVHYTDPRGRLVVTVEAPGIEASMERVEEIGRFHQVLSVSLAQYCLEANELERSPKFRGDAVPRESRPNRAPDERENA